MNRREYLTRGANIGIALGVGLLAVPLSGCGFKLRGSLNFAFDTIAVNPTTGGQVAAELRRALASNVRLVGVDAPAGTGAVTGPAQVVLDVVSEQREKTVVGVNAAGQVREFQLRIRVKFKLRSAQGKALIDETELLQQRDISFNESAVLAKETEEALLYRDMQTDIVQQLMRRLAAIKAL
jgi:LPS-assembly lipoprotein